MSYEKQVWSKYDALKPEDENIENGAVVTDSRMNHMENGISYSSSTVENHIANKLNPHSVTKNQVGLGNVQNFGLATEDEAKQGDSNAKYMTPSLTQAVLSANINSIAYANSADGTDGFTTVYPNLNLLDGTKDFKPRSAGNGTSNQNTREIYFTQNKTVADLFKAGDYITISYDIEFLNTELYSSSEDVNITIQMHGGSYTWISQIKAKNVDGKFYTKDSFKSSDYVETPTHKVKVSRTIQLTQDFINANATVNSIELVYNSIPVGANTNPTNLKIEPAKDLNSTATPWMPSSSEVTTADYPKYVGFSNTVKTDKTASDYTWFPYLTNKVEDHVNNRSNPHGVTASQVGSYTKSEVATLISEAIKQSKLDANPIGTILTTISNTNPSTYIGGTWERFANGRTLVGVDESDSVTLMQTANKMGGSINPETEHEHSMGIFRGSNPNVGSGGTGGYSWGEGTESNPSVKKTFKTGDNTNHNNWQPFVTVYFWRRTA